MLLLVTVAVVAMCGAFADPKRGGGADTLPGGSDGAGTEAEMGDSDPEAADTEVSNPEPDSPEDTDGEETSAPSETPSEGDPAESIFESEVLPNTPGESDDALPSETEEPTDGGVTNGDGGETRPTDETVDTDADTDADTEEERDTAEESDLPALRPVPEGCYPIEPLDMSLTEHGAGYVQGALEGLPPALPREDLWTGEGMPTVLIIHTHPFEGYGDGKPWYDPAAGSLAVTDSPYDPEGVVALGAALSRSLREAGVTVIHLRVAVSESDSAADVYNRTEAAVRSYCSMYPDIGLVIDLRRSAEMTEAGGILRTAGELDGEACAQLRISVNGGRGEGAVERDLAAALALREALWQVSPTISRPVRVKSGSGIAGVAEGVCQLTLELGAAGNPYPEAQRLVAPLATALGNVLNG
jgi:stage II sporulation protein P